MEDSNKYSLIQDLRRKLSKFMKWQKFKFLKERFIKETNMLKENQTKIMEKKQCKKIYSRKHYQINNTNKKNLFQWWRAK